MTTMQDEAVSVRGVTVNLTNDDIEWLDRRKRRTAESRSTILRTLVREARERDEQQAEATA